MSAQVPPYRVFVHIDVERKRYTRYIGKTRTHAFVAAELMAAEWVEELRVSPELYGPEDPLEAA